MVWKIVGLIESRSGDLEVMPEWVIGTPNAFDSYNDANVLRESMQQIHVASKEKTAIRYLVLPAIDPSLLNQVRGINQPQQPAPPPAPAINFGLPQQKAPPA